MGQKHPRKFLAMLQNNVFKKKQKCCLNDGMNRIRRYCCFSYFLNHLDILRMHRFSRSWPSNINFENYALCFVSLSTQLVLWCFHAGLEPTVCFPKKMTIPDPVERHEFQQWKAAWQGLPGHPLSLRENFTGTSPPKFPRATFIRYVPPFVPHSK